MPDKRIVLAIDDSEEQLRIFSGILSANYDLRAVKSASGAIAYLNANKADVILLDIGMPHVNGFEFLSDIRKIPSYMDVPIIIVSGNSGPEFFNQARNSGAFDVLSKPVLPDALINTIEKSLGNQG